MHKLTVLIAVAVVAGLAKLQPIQPVIVIGPSMEPTFHSMQCVLATRNFDTIRRGDIVVFQRDGAAIVKRVAYLPGDRVIQYQKANTWYVPGDEHEDWAYDRSGAPRRTLVVPQGTIFVLGDNVGDSTDSRDFGPVLLVDVMAKVMESDGGGSVLPSAKVASRTSIRLQPSGDWS